MTTRGKGGVNAPSTDRSARTNNQSLLISREGGFSKDV